MHRAEKRARGSTETLASRARDFPVRFLTYSLPRGALRPLETLGTRQTREIQRSAARTRFSRQRFQ